ncbi:hypothetical protein COD66_29680 [Bacillus cereus]|nr:hypothetical protein COD66_29680 [Bacillus cereus]
MWKKVDKLIKKIFKFYLEHFLIFCFTVGIALIMLVLQYIFSDIDTEFGLSLIPNFIADMIGILFTSYIISILFQRSEEKKTKEKAYKITGSRYLGLINTIGTNYVHLITRKPYGHKSNNQKQEMKEQILDILTRLEEYVPADFMNNKVELHSIIQQQGVTKIEKQYLEYQRFCRRFKKEYEEVFEKFIIRYIGFLPDDLRERVLNVEILLGRVLATPIDFGLNLQMVVVYDEYIANLREIGQEVIILIDYFEEYGD